MRETASTKSKD